MADFRRVIEWLQSGRKVRRPQWESRNYLHLVGDEIRNNVGDRVNFCNINSFLATDWESYENEKSFMVCMCCGRKNGNHTAYCVKCGRTPHRMMTKKECTKFKEFLGELTI